MTDDELYDRHVQSWQRFADLSEQYTVKHPGRPTLEPLAHHIDSFGFSKLYLEDQPGNARNCNDDWEGLPLSHCNLKPQQGLTATKKPANLTCICGSGYPMFRNGSTYLNGTDKVCIFNLRLAQTFLKTSMEGRQIICPIQIRLNDTFFFDKKIKNKTLPPHLDLDDCLCVSAKQINNYIDSQGFVQQSIKDLHFNPEQLRHRAKICIQVLAKMINIQPSSIFAVTMKTQMPGVDFVRVDDPDVAYNWRFAAKLIDEQDVKASNAKRRDKRIDGELIEYIEDERDKLTGTRKGAVKLKPSSWIVFGLTSFLKREVQDDEFESSDEDSSFIANVKLMMKRKAIPNYDRQNNPEMFIHSRGFGILLSDAQLQVFRKNVAHELVNDCKNKDSDKFWKINGAIQIKPSDIKVDDGAQGLRPPHASKNWPCCYHTVYNKEQTEIIQSQAYDECITKKFKQEKELCAKLCHITTEVRKQPIPDDLLPRKCRCPYPTGVHLNEEGVDSKDIWMLTARCNEVVEISDGTGESIEWCKRLIKHPKFGFMFQSSLANLYVDSGFSEGLRPSRKAGLGVPGILLSGDFDDKNCLVNQRCQHNPPYHLLNAIECNITFNASLQESVWSNDSTSENDWLALKAEELLNDPKYKKMLKKIDPASPAKYRLQVNKSLEQYVDEKFGEKIDDDYHYLKQLKKYLRVVTMFDINTCENYHFIKDENDLQYSRFHKKDHLFPKIDIKVFVHEKDNGKLNGMVVALGPVPGNKSNGGTHCGGFFCPHRNSIDPFGSFHEYTKESNIGPCVVIKYDEIKRIFIYSVCCGHPDCVDRNHNKTRQPLSVEFCEFDSKWLSELFGIEQRSNQLQSKRQPEFRDFREQLRNESLNVKKKAKK